MALTPITLLDLDLRTQGPCFMLPLFRAMPPGLAIGEAKIHPCNN